MDFTSIEFNRTVVLPPSSTQKSSEIKPEKHHKLRMLEGFLQSLWDHGELVVLLP